MTHTPHTIEDMPPYLLQWAWDGKGHKDGLKTHCRLVLTNAETPCLQLFPGSNVVLVTSQYAMGMKWNSMMALSKTCGPELTLIICPAFDTVGHWPKLEENLRWRQNPREAVEINDMNMTQGMELALGIEVMVTFMSLQTWMWWAECKGT